MKRVAGYVLVAILTMAAVVGVSLLTRPMPAPNPAAETRPDLRRWSLQGCWELEVEPWAGTGTADAPAGSAEAAGRLPAPLTPPDRVMLLADSVDLYGRDLPSFRAVPVPWDRERPERALRWFTRADTLWLLWRERGVRAGIALFREGEIFSGSARALGDTLDVTARAEAWPINCATYRRQTGRRPDRP